MTLTLGKLTNKYSIKNNLTSTDDYGLSRVNMNILQYNIHKLPLIQGSTCTNKSTD